ncbi:MAG: MATE family efflux transporter [Cyclobacteriaceae bacterium]|nr:MAG: MATE family efflux transporter [Cyclobacteriaceae bacterium]
MLLKEHIRINFLLAGPVMLSMLGQVMTGVADSVMIGWTGTTPLAAASLANVLFTLLLTFGIGISYALTPLVAEAHGRNSQQEVSSVLKHGLLIGTVAGMVLVAIGLAATPLLHHINQPEEVVALALPYQYIIIVSIFPTMLFQTGRQFAEGLHQTFQAMVVVITCNLINIGLNYVFIFGKLGFPAMGLNGAGWATLIARTLMGVWMMLYVYSGGRFAAYRSGFAWGHYSRQLIGKMLHIGIPAGIQFIFEVSAFGFSAIMMGWLGAIPLAAHQIAINLATISYMMTSGLGAAATIRVGNYLGQRNIRLLREAAFSLLAMGAGIMLLWGIVFLAGRHYLPSLYIDDTEVIRTAAPLLVIAALFQLWDGLQVVGAGALRGLQDVKIPSLLIFIAYWVIGLPMGYFLAFKLRWGPNGIWVGLLIGLFITASAMVWRFNKLSRKLMLPLPGAFVSSEKISSL